MAQEGIEFRTNVEVGKDIDPNDLFISYDAILVATGATWPRDLNIPSTHDFYNLYRVMILYLDKQLTDLTSLNLDRHLNGIYFAMSFLQGWQEQQSACKDNTKTPNPNLQELKALAKDKKVLIIGGGDTGCDCIGTSLRQVKYSTKTK